VWLLAGKLPMGAGFDDIFITCMFIGSLMRSGGRLDAKTPVIFAILFCVILFLGDMSTISAGDSVTIGSCLKLWLKHLGLVFLLFSVCVTVKTPSHIMQLVYSLLFGAMLAGALVVFYVINPNVYNPFQIPYYISGLDPSVVKVMGPFNYHDVAGGVLGFTVLLGYFITRSAKRSVKKSVAIIITGISLIGLLLSGSRSGWVFVMFPMVLSSLFSKQKIMGIALLLLIAVAVSVSLAKSEYFSSRVEETISQLKGERSEGATAGRTIIWKETLSNPKLRWLFFGEGFGVMEGAHTHSNYIAMLRNTGLIGILYWFLFYKGVFKKSFWIAKYDSDIDMSALFKGVFWAYIGYFLFFMPSTPMMWSQVRYVNFFLM